MHRLAKETQILNDIVRTASYNVKDMLDMGVVAKVKDGEPGGSHHSIGTEADDASQVYLLKSLRSIFPGSFYLAEEECEGPDLITNDNLEQVKHGRVFIIDSVDGTAGAYRRRWDWSVVGNWMQDGVHIGGAICAPDVRGTFLVAADKNVKGAFLIDDNNHSENYFRVSVSERPIKKSTVLIGVDVLKRSQFVPFAHKLANAVETCVTAGSCGLGVAAVAAGRAEAIVQPHQWPWDWASAAIIEAAGGTVQYYHYRGGEIVALDRPDLMSYHRSNRTNLGGLGFIAGAPDLVTWLFRELKANWQLQK